MTLRTLTVGLVLGLAVTAAAVGAGYAQTINKGSMADFADPKDRDPLGPNAVGNLGAGQATDKYSLAYRALRAGNYKDASRMFDELLVQTPDDAVVLVYSGMSLAGLNNFKAAQRVFEHALRVQPKSIAAHRELGVTLAKQGNTKSAQGELDKLKKLTDDCKGVCPDAPVLTSSVKTVETAISAAPAKAG